MQPDLKTVSGYEKAHPSHLSKTQWIHLSKESSSLGLESCLWNSRVVGRLVEDLFLMENYSVVRWGLCLSLALFKTLLSVSWDIYQKWNCQSTWWLFFNSLGNHHTIFCCSHTLSTPTSSKCSNFSTSSPTLFLFCFVFNSSLPNGCGGFSPCWASLHVFTDHFYIFICLLTISISSISSLEKFLFKSFTYFWNQVCFCCCWV